MVKKDESITTAAKRSSSKRKASMKQKELSNTIEKYEENNCDLVGIGKKYPRKPRILPDIAGVYSLTKTEVKRDIREIENEFLSLHAVLYPSKRKRQSENHLDSNKFIKKRRSRHHRPLSPEEVLATLPACRKAVRMTKRELMMAKHERDELERLYMNLRCTLIWKLKKYEIEKENQNGVLEVLRNRVTQAAQNIEARKRRNTSLQNILMELEHQEKKNYNLRKEINVLKTVLKKNNISAPIPDDFEEGDSVESPFGKGIIQRTRAEDEIVVIKHSDQTTAYVNSHELSMIEKSAFLSREEDKIKKKFLSYASDWVDSQISITSVDEKNLREEDDESESEKHSSTPPNSKKSIFEFVGCTLPATPRNVPLLLSPLSTLPDNVAAVGCSGLQWFTSCLPKELEEWEEERLEHQKNKGDLHRLKHQLSQSEALRKDLQRQLKEQMESINYLVSELKKSREGKPNKKRDGSPDINTDSLVDLKSVHHVQEVFETDKIDKPLEINDDSAEVIGDENRNETSIHESINGYVENIDQEISTISSPNNANSTRSSRRSLRSRAKSPGSGSEKSNQNEIQRSSLEDIQTSKESNSQELSISERNKSSKHKVEACFEFNSEEGNNEDSTRATRLTRSKQGRKSKCKASKQKSRSVSTRVRTSVKRNSSEASLVINMDNAPTRLSRSSTGQKESQRSTRSKRRLTTT